MILAAPRGVSGSGEIYVGTGVGAVFGTFSLPAGVDVAAIQESGDPTMVISENEFHVYVHDAWKSIARLKTPFDGCIERAWPEIQGDVLLQDQLYDASRTRPDRPMMGGTGPRWGQAATPITSMCPQPFLSAG